MKKFFTAFVCILSLATTSLAQNVEPTKEEIATQRTASLAQMSTAAKEVGLDEKKIAKLTVIFEDLFKKIDEIKADATTSAEAKKEKLKAANGNKDWKVKDLLGDKYKEYSEVRKRLMAEAAAAKKQ